MFENVNGVWGAVGVSLALIALYLVLAYAASAKDVIGALGGAATNVFKTLQAR
jgi:hypothetical protein